VLTPLGIEAPLRYVSGVPARVGAEPCPCGAVGTVLEPWHFEGPATARPRSTRPV